MKLWTGCAVLAMIAGLALVGCGKKEGPGSVSVDQSSAKATLDTMAKALKARDGDAMAACMPPEYRETMRQTFGATMDLLNKADSFKKAVQAKFGKDATEKALAGSPADAFAKNGPVGDCVNEDGTIDWKKVKVTENGDAATIEVEGKSDKGTMKKIDGKWCVAAPEGTTPENAKTEAQKAQKQIKAMCEALDAVEKQIQEGKLSKVEDVDKAMGDAMKKIEQP